SWNAAGSSKPVATRSCSRAAARMRNSTNCSSRKRPPTRPNEYDITIDQDCSPMIKSMTGFASLTHEDERATIAVTVRAVNHRFLDLQLRVPHAFGDVESRLRALLQKRLARGRVEMGISVQVRELGAPTVELNMELARALSAAMEQAREQGLVS